MKLMRDYPGRTQAVIIAIALLVVCLGSGGCFLKKGKGGSGKGEKVELKQWKLDEFLVNLADANENRYLKVNLVLEVAGEPPKEAEGEGGGGGGESIKARDAVITVLTKKSYNSLISETGKSDLKAELKKAINEAMEGKVKVENIYFTSFAMQ